MAWLRLILLGESTGRDEITMSNLFGCTATIHGLAFILTMGEWKIINESLGEGSSYIDQSITIELLDQASALCHWQKRIVDDDHGHAQHLADIRANL